MEAAEFVEELAEQENDSMAKDTFLSQAAFCHSEAVANMKNIFDTVDHIIELSEINAALNISIADHSSKATKRSQWAIKKNKPCSSAFSPVESPPPYFITLLHLLYSPL